MLFRIKNIIKIIVLKNERKSIIRYEYDDIYFR